MSNKNRFKKKVIALCVILLVTTLTMGNSESTSKDADVAHELLKSLDSLSTELVKFKELKGRQ